MQSDQTISDTENMRKFIIVIHSFYVSSKGFEEIKIEAKDIQSAYDRAKALSWDKQDTFHHTAYTVLEIAKDESFKKYYDHEIKKIPNWVRMLFGCKD